LVAVEQQDVDRLAVELGQLLDQRLVAAVDRVENIDTYMPATAAVVRRTLHVVFQRLVDAVRQDEEDHPHHGGNAHHGGDAPAATASTEPSLAASALGSVVDESLALAEEEVGEAAAPGAAKRRAA
jgi:hypothetical protein